MRTQPSEEDRPFVLEWRITNHCNLGCLPCNRGTGPSQLNPEKMSAVLDEFQRFCLGLKRPGVVRLGGGEPLLSPHLLSLVRSTRARGLTPELRTNGTLITKKEAAHLHNAGLRQAYVRLHGLGPSHDVLTRPGAFEQALEGMELLRGVGEGHRRPVPHLPGFFPPRVETAPQTDHSCGPEVPDTPVHGRSSGRYLGKAASKVRALRLSRGP